jgi:hypothetical protein
LYGLKKYLKNLLPRYKKAYIIESIKNFLEELKMLSQLSFKTQHEYRPIGSANSADMPWLVDRGFV